MPATLRVFVLDESGRLSRFGRARWDRLWNGEAALPERAGQAVRFLEVLVETHNRLPIRMGDIHGLIFQLDAKGRLEPEQRERMLRSAGERLAAYLRVLPGSRRGTILPADHIEWRSQDLQTPNQLRLSTQDALKVFACLRREGKWLSLGGGSSPRPTARLEILQIRGARAGLRLGHSSFRQEPATG